MKTYITLLLLVFSLSLSAQTIKEQQDAFAISYQNEAAKNYSVAIVDIEKIYIEDSYEINVRLGWLSYLQGDYPNSIKYYKISLHLLPYSIQAKFGYILPLAAMGNWNEVIAMYKEVLKTDPQNSYANYKLGAIYYERAEFPLAKQHAEKVTNMYPYDNDAIVLLAWIHLKMEDYRKAKILFNKSLLISPQNTSALEGLKLIQ